MPFIPVPNVAQVNMRFLWDGQRCENVFNVQYTSPPDAATLLLLAGLFADWWVPDMRPNISPAAQLTEVYAVDMSTASGETATYNTGLPSAGGSGSPSVPNNVAFCITFRTAFRGRSFRGRSYVLGIPEDKFDVSRMLPAAVTGYVTAYNNLIDQLQTIDTPLVVVSKYADGAPRAAGVATPVQIAIALDNVADSQRRRLPGRGA